jgi:acyl carrier protein
MMDAAEFLARIEHALDVPAGSLRQTDGLADVEKWDSIGALMVIAAIDKHYGVVLSGEALLECQTLADLARLVEAGSRPQGCPPTLE